MKKIIFVDEIIIGNFCFQCYVLDRENDYLSFSVFIKDMDIPFVDFIADPQLTVEIKFHEETIDFINKNKTLDKNKRKEYFKIFYDYLIDSEKKARYMVFKRKKLNYIKNATELIALKKMYINE